MTGYELKPIEEVCLHLSLVEFARLKVGLASFNLPLVVIIIIIITVTVILCLILILASCAKLCTTPPGAPPAGNDEVGIHFIP